MVQPGRVFFRMPNEQDRPAPTICDWCAKPFAGVKRRLRSDARYCSQRCRQWAWRVRKRVGSAAVPATPQPGTFAYSDPPYIGLAERYYADQPDYAGEVDHEKLIADLRAGPYIGWALSCSERSLRYLLPLCPAGAHVCPWVKPGGIAQANIGLTNSWEPLIVVGGRQRPPGVRDWLRALPARSGGNLMGRKPIAFATFLFKTLGMQPGDTLVDMFPGSGMVTRAWKSLSDSWSRETLATAQPKRAPPAYADRNGT